MATATIEVPWDKLDELYADLKQHGGGCGMPHPATFDPYKTGPVGTGPQRCLVTDSFLRLCDGRWDSFIV